MAAIFDLTIASLVAPWWTSTSVIPHVSRPTNSVQVRNSPDTKLWTGLQARSWTTGLSHCGPGPGLQISATAPLSSCLPEPLRSALSHSSSDLLDSDQFKRATLNVCEPLWLPMSQPAANTSGLLSFVYVTTPCFHDFSQSLCCDTLWPQSPSTGRLTKEYNVCCQTNKAYFE